MAGNSRSELASNSPERSSFTAVHPNGQRGSYSGATLERSGSFRESIDSRALSSGTGSTRSPASMPPTEILSPSQYLLLEPLSLGEPKYTRVGELRKVLGVSPEEHSFGTIQCKPLNPAAAEELKRFKASVTETAARARERTKVLHESLGKLERYHNLISRKRQRSDITSGERSGGANLLKMGSQIRQNPSDIIAQRLEERAKNIVPSKRVRSSMGEAEGRATVPLRQGAAVEKDKSTFMEKERSMLRACNGVSVIAEDKMRTLPVGGEGWEKKMKRKRSVGAVNRTTDGDTEFKPALQRLSNESRPRPSNGLTFRPGSSCGISDTSKNDSSSQLNVASSRAIPRNDFENVCTPSDRREHSAALDKEWGLTKGGDKLSIREDTQIRTQSPLVKGKASRGPRSASSSMMNSSSNFQRTSGGIDGWDQPPCLNKVQPLSGVINRKRPLPESSSPPVAQWGGHRPPKSTRSRRMLVHSVSIHDDMLAEVSPPVDVGARVMTTEAGGHTLSRGMSSTQQLKLKPENVPSPVGVSESEELGSAESKSKEKGLDTGKIEDGTMNAVQKAATLILSSKKNKLLSREEIGDGVRRQGRSGRVSAQPKVGVSLSKEKWENLETVKPLRMGRPVSEISKVGRPPSKKMSDRKAFIHPGHVVNSGSSYQLGESDDDHDELLLAANSARNASYESCSSPFWKKVEQVFSFVGDDDIAYLKQQINFAGEVDGSLCNLVDAGQLVMTLASPEKQVQSNPVGISKSAGMVCSFDDSQQFTAESGKLVAERWLEKIFPLSQRLLAAFIEEDETEMHDCGTGHEDVFVHSASDYSPCGTASHISFESKELGRTESEHEPVLDFATIMNCSRDNSCNGYGASINLRSPSTRIVSYNGELSQENNILPQLKCSGHGQYHIEIIPSMRTVVSGSLYECQYEHMCLDDKILIELQNIGLYPDTVPGLEEVEDEEIDRDLSELKMRLYEQMRKKKHHLSQLARAIQNTKAANERMLEQIAMDKLVDMAYKKYLGGRGSHGSSNKSGVNKSKQVALTFVKRVLIRCRTFEETGLSCFSETTFRDALFSAPLRSTDAKSIGVLHGVVPNMFAEISNGHWESRLEASGVLTNMTERNGPIGLKLESYSCQSDSCQGPALSDQAFAKQEPITNRGKKREVLLDVVGGTSSRPTEALSSSIPGGAKGKRSERERDQNLLSRNSVPKVGCPALGSVRGEHKSKAKPKQRTAQLSTSGNCLLGRFTVPSVHESLETANNGASKGNEMLFSGSNASNSSKDVEETVDFTNLPLNAIDELDVGDALGGQGQDIGSWLSVDDDALQDNDLIMGLEIPMDDLSELNMNF